MRFVTALLGLICAVQMPFAHSAEPAAKADPAQAQQIVTKVCAACHATDGNSVSPANPVLAGQHADYIVKQLTDFKANKDRKNPVMLGMASALSPQDMKNLGAYFESQKPKSRAAKDPALVKLGQQIYRGGIMAKGVAACTSCQGPPALASRRSFHAWPVNMRNIPSRNCRAFGWAIARTIRTA